MLAHGFHGHRYVIASVVASWKWNDKWFGHILLVLKFCVQEDCGSQSNNFSVLLLFVLF